MEPEGRCSLSVKWKFNAEEVKSNH